MVRTAIAAILLATGQPVMAQDMVLVCNGAMRGLFTDRTAGGALVDADGGVTSARAGTASYGDIPTTAEFRLTGESAQLNLPQPPTCSVCTGEKGWREVRELQVDDTRISGRIRYGLLSGTRFEIDRRTGVMTSENGFRGECALPDLSQRKF